MAPKPGNGMQDEFKQAEREFTMALAKLEHSCKRELNAQLDAESQRLREALEAAHRKETMEQRAVIDRLTTELRVAKATLARVRQQVEGEAPGGAA